MISSVFLSECNRTFSGENQFFLLNTVKTIVRVFAKDELFLKKKVLNQWNNSFSFSNSMIDIDFKHSCVNLIDHFWRKSMFLQ